MNMSFSLPFLDLCLYSDFPQSSLPPIKPFLGWPGPSYPQISMSMSAPPGGASYPPLPLVSCTYSIQPVVDFVDITCLLVLSLSLKYKLVKSGDNLSYFHFITSIKYDTWPSTNLKTHLLNKSVGAWKVNQRCAYRKTSINAILF